MKNTVNKEDVIQALKEICEGMIEHQALLTELDSAIGDGDLGITFTKGCKAILESLDRDSSSISQVLIQAGIDFSNKTGATMGALIGTALIRAGKSAKGKTELDAQDLVKVFIASEAGVIERGKGTVGDKTLLDALIPAREAFEKAVESKKNLVEAFNQATLAAEAGMNSTIEMEAKLGRARWLGPRSVGHKDPGATAIFLLMQLAQESYKRMVKKAK
jgi:phosphoenolpyruvate---glycerone phosphotransferase subunit DhaL